MAEDSHEEDDTPTQADAKGYLAEATDCVGAALDDDYFVINVQAGHEKISVSLAFVHASGDLDLRLYDSDGTTPLDWSLTRTDNESIFHEVGGAGDYYLRVEPVAFVGGDYLIRWEGTEPSPGAPGGGEGDSGGGCSPAVAAEGGVSLLALLVGAAVALACSRRP